MPIKNKMLKLLNKSMLLIYSRFHFPIRWSQIKEICPWIFQLEIPISQSHSSLPADPFHSSQALSVTVGVKYWMGDLPRISSWRSIRCSLISFLLLLFCVLCGVIFKSVLKSTFSIISASGFRKKTKSKHKYGSAVRMKLIILRAVVQSWNFADFVLCIGRKTGKTNKCGFSTCKTIIMPLIFQSSVPLFPCLLLSALPSLCYS